MRVPFRLVDVFAEAPFGGNQLCVVPESPTGSTTRRCRRSRWRSGSPRPPSSRPSRPDGYDVRIFTPEVELPFAGPSRPSGPRSCSRARALIGTDDGAATARAGDIPVAIDLDGGRARDAAAAARLRSRGRRIAPRSPRPPGSSPTTSSTDCRSCRSRPGIPHLHGAGARRRGAPSRRRVTIAGASGCARRATTPSRSTSSRSADDGDVRARMFDRFPTIGEDPATGSAAGPLGAYLAAHGSPGMPGTAVDRAGRAGRPAVVPARRRRSRRGRLAGRRRRGRPADGRGRVRALGLHRSALHARRDRLDIAVGGDDRADVRGLVRPEGQLVVGAPSANVAAVSP